MVSHCSRTHNGNLWDWNQWSESECKLKTEGRGAEEERAGNWSLLMGCWTLGRRRGRMKLKSNKRWRQLEGGSAPSGQEGLTVVIKDNSTGKRVNFQGKSENGWICCIRWLLWKGSRRLNLYEPRDKLTTETSTYGSAPELPAPLHYNYQHRQHDILKVKPKHMDTDK